MPLSRSSIDIKAKTGRQNSHQRDTTLDEHTRETNLVVDDDVDRPPDGEVIDPRHLHRLVHNPLPGEGCVSVDEDRHRPLLRFLTEKGRQQQQDEHTHSNSHDQACRVGCVPFGSRIAQSAEECLEGQNTTEASDLEPEKISHI